MSNGSVTCKVYTKKFYSVGKEGEFAEIGRNVFREEYAQALQLAEALGLRLDPRSCSEGRSLARATAPS